MQHNADLNQAASQFQQWDVIYERTLEKNVKRIKIS